MLAPMDIATKQLNDIIISNMAEEVEAFPFALASLQIFFIGNHNIDLELLANNNYWLPILYLAR